MPEVDRATLERVRELRVRRAHELLARRPEELFLVAPVGDRPPRKARVHASVPCAGCGEETIETRARRLEGRELCPECFEEALAAR